MASGRTWPAYAVLALCGAPIFVIAAWKIVRDTPVESLVIELDSGGNATITAKRRRTSDVRTGFRLPRDSDRLCEAVRGFVREVRLDANHLPVCPVRVVVPGDARVDLISEMIVMAYRNYLAEMMLTAGGAEAVLQLEGPGDLPVPALLPQSDVALAGLRLRTDSRGRGLETVRLKQGCADRMPLVSSSESMIIRDGSAEAVIPETFCREILVRLDEPRVGIAPPQAWHELADLAEGGETVALAGPEDADLSGVDGACLLTTADARAADLVRALAFLTSRKGLKVCIMWPEREETRDWWLAP